MNPKNVRTMAVAAVVIVICLLFSWVQYGGSPSEDQDGGFDGTWYPVYSYNSGIPAEVTVPESLTASSDDHSVTLSDGASELTFTKLSDTEAVSDSTGRGYQIYFEDGTLYLVTVYDDAEINGIIYIAMSRDSTATLPSDRVDLTGTSLETSVSMSDGESFTAMPSAILTIESHSFHIAKGTVASEGGSYDFTGFVKSDGTRSVIVGCYVASDGSVGMFDAVIDGGEGAFALEGINVIVGQTSGMTSGLPDGSIEIETHFDTMVFDVDVEGCLANVVGDVICFPASVMWTLGDDYLLFGSGSIAAADGSEYFLVVNNLVA